MPQSSLLDASGVLLSDLWIDQPDALDVLASRAAGRGMTSREQSEAERLISRGYAVLDLNISSDVTDQIDRDVDRLWTERPRDVAWGGAIGDLFGDFAMSDIPATITRTEPKNYRFCCAHSHSEAMRSLFFHEDLHRFVSFLFGEPAIATQTLYFEYGSRQGQHRDTAVVTFRKPSHMLAAWIALEDIDLDSGPLEYIPGSHRIENYVFDDGSPIWDARYGPDSMAKMNMGIRSTAAQHGLEPERFAAKRGQVLIWHHSLSHGGAQVMRPELTRKSLVIHFTTQSTFESRDHALHFRPRDSEEFWRFQKSTSALENHHGCLGAASAIENWHEQPEPPARPAIRRVNPKWMGRLFHGPTDDAIRGCLDSASVANDHLILSGWALDNRTNQPAENIITTVDGEPIHIGVVDQLRPDIASIYGPNSAYSGFYVMVPSAALRPGKMQVWCATNDGLFNELAYQPAATTSLDGALKSILSSGP